MQAQTLPTDLAASWQMIRRYQQVAPVNVERIAEDFGIKVYAKDLGKNVSGILRKDSTLGGSSGYVILVHTQHHINRQRFTVAHELGHFVLHRDRVNEKGDVEEDEFYRAFPGPLERDANKFAADVLMPWTLINNLTSMGITDLPTMAQKLAVSRQALAIRLGLPYDQGGWE